MLGMLAGAVGAIVAAVLTSLSIYAIVSARRLELPVPALGHILAILLPLATVIGLSPLGRLNRPRFLQRFIYGREKGLLFLISLLDVALITLASTLTQASILTCELEQRWRSLFQAHEVQAIRHIQDRFDCCGLRTPLDQPWPFPDHRGASRCREEYGRQGSCEAPWRAEQIRILSIWISIGALTLSVKLFFYFLQPTRPAWFGEENQRFPRQHYLQGSDNPSSSSTHDPAEEGRYADRDSPETPLRSAESAA